jgi:hypothetical protein
VSCSQRWPEAYRTIKRAAEMVFPHPPSKPSALASGFCIGRPDASTFGSFSWHVGHVKMFSCRIKHERGMKLTRLEKIFLRRYTHLLFVARRRKDFAVAEFVRILGVDWLASEF